jgi:hypothetical protein
VLIAAPACARADTREATGGLSLSSGDLEMQLHLQLRLAPNCPSRVSWVAWPQDIHLHMLHISRGEFGSSAGHPIAARPVRIAEQP